MSNVSLLDSDSLVSISSQDDSFYVLASTIQSLYSYLRDSYSSGAIKEYMKLIAHLLEQDLDLTKRFLVHQYLVEMITELTTDEYAIRYFKQRFAQMTLLELLEYHHKMTGNLLILSNLNYSEKKFKIKQVKLGTKDYTNSNLAA